MVGGVYFYLKKFIWGIAENNTSKFNSNCIFGPVLYYFSFHTFTRPSLLTTAPLNFLLRFHHFSTSRIRMEN